MGRGREEEVGVADVERCEQGCEQVQETRRDGVTHTAHLCHKNAYSQQRSVYQGRPGHRESVHSQ